MKNATEILSHEILKQMLADKNISISEKQQVIQKQIKLHLFALTSLNPVFNAINKEMANDKTIKTIS